EIAILRQVVGAEVYSRFICQILTSLFTERQPIRKLIIIGSLIAIVCIPAGTKVSFKQYRKALGCNRSALSLPIAAPAGLYRHTVAAVLCVRKGSALRRRRLQRYIICRG